MSTRVFQATSLLETNTMKQKFKCEGCDEMFDYAIEVEQHMKTHFQRFRCQPCEKCFARKYCLMIHEKLHIAKRFQCHLCKSLFRLGSELDGHKETCTGKLRPFKCSICSKCFGSELMLSVHQNIHSETYKCNVCGKCHNTGTQLNIHKKSHSAGKRLCRIECSRCLHIFRSPNELKVHAEECHKQKYSTTATPPTVKRRGRKKRVNSDLAATSFGTASEESALNENNRPSITCDFCNQVCESKKLLKQHCFDNRLGNFQLFSCLLCQYSSSNRRLVAAHCRKEHRNAKLFKHNLPNDEDRQLMLDICHSLSKKGIVHELSESGHKGVMLQIYSFEIN